MKYNISLILIFVCLINISSEEIKNKDDFIDMLIKSTWKSLSFEKKDNRLNYLTVSGGTGKAIDQEGFVEINFKKKEITFHQERRIDKDNKEIFKTYILIYYKTDKDLEYSEYIGNYPKIESKLKEGTKRKYKDVDVIILNSVSIGSKYNMYIREKPSTKSDYYIFKCYSEEPTEFIRIGFEAIARTEKKYKIGDKKSYWFLIKFNSIDFMFCSVYLKNDPNKINKLGTGYGWIYGGYLSLSRDTGVKQGPSGNPVINITEDDL